jgi:hypothetical protein
MEKIYYNKEGFVCERYPLDYPIEDENMFIEVVEEEFHKTFSTIVNYAWMVKDKKLVNERYQEDEVNELLQLELEQIQIWLKQNDWKPNKITTGEWTTDDPRWIQYLSEREVKRARQDEINALMGV